MIGDGMVSVFMSSEGISCPALLLAHKTNVSWTFNMSRLYVLEYVCFDFGCGETIQTLPLPILQFFHL